MSADETFTKRQIHQAMNSWDSGVDVVRVVAAFLVVCVHCNFYFAEAKQGVQSTDWLFSCTVASFSRVCVPLFFLISGCLLLKPGLDPIAFYRKRLVRILVPLFFWSSVYLWARISMQGNQISLLSACRLIYNGEVYYHLGFLYLLVAVYLAIPFLQPLTEGEGGHLLLVFSGLAFLLGSLLPFCDRVLAEVGGFSFRLGVPAGVFWVYAGYAALGAIVGRLRASQKQLWMAGALFLIASAATTILTVLEARRIGASSEKWFGYGEPTIFLAAVSAFIVLRSVALSPRNTSLLRVLGRLTFGIYLIHPLVIDLLKKVGWPPPMSSLGGLPVNVLCVFILSAVATAVISRIPFLHKTV